MRLIHSRPGLFGDDNQIELYCVNERLQPLFGITMPYAYDHNGPGA